jgi:hypothetical protein
LVKGIRAESSSRLSQSKPDKVKAAKNERMLQGNINNEGVAG